MHVRPGRATHDAVRIEEPMLNPPFRLARTPGPDTEAGVYRPLADACCTPANDKAVRPPALQRTRLAELDPHLHCSIIGTCMSTAELRKLVPRFAAVDRQHASDLEIHHEAVQLSIDGGPGCKALQKSLDDRYELAVRHFSAAKDPETLLQLWKDALKSGDVPPAYWAVMTHPYATIDVRQAAFGEVHMLSHLVGAANRADIRRLVALEEENAALRDKVDHQQGRLHEMSNEHDAALRELNARLIQVSALAERQSTAQDADLRSEVKALREALEARDQQIALQTSRREAAEQRAIDEVDASTAVRKRLDEALALLKVVEAESDAIERAMLSAVERTVTRRTALEVLNGKRIVYVGGRPGSNTTLKSLVESAGGEFTVHDGGIEDRKGLLAPVVARADMVVFPVDCIDHDSMSMLKRVCDRHGVPYFPLRTASVASFVELATRVNIDAPVQGNVAPPSRFCLRHG
jgi:hypothetical protein